ncbi:MAG: BTAD domain-containing putative transcriptional regulator, partial [Kiloniellales bacterium]|nr:BTAD domain-containing putative transcriptional regulator [Kiloniellales bacterium]
MDIKSRKGTALLAFLAATGQEASRDLLASLLWPEFSQTRARANLRRTLYTLNQSLLARWLRVEGEMLSLKPEDDSLIDIRRFDQLVRNATHDGLVEALSLYRAGFLEGFFLPDSEPFDEWRTVQQQTYQRRALEALDQLVERLLEGGDYREAEGYVRRQLEIDNFREPAWRQLMTVLTLSGRRSEALVEFEKCRRLLQEELGVEPAAETLGLADEIRSHSPEITSHEVEHQAQKFSLESPQSGALPDLRLVPSPYRGLFAFREEDAPYFFGREDFVEKLITAVGEQSILPVIGPSGSGKSSVVYAGLVPWIKEKTDWVVASFRPGQRPMQALAASLVALLDESLSE